MSELVEKYQSIHIEIIIECLDFVGDLQQEVTIYKKAKYIQKSKRRIFYSG